MSVPGLEPLVAGRTCGERCSGLDSDTAVAPGRGIAVEWETGIVAGLEEAWIGLVVGGRKCLTEEGMLSVVGEGSTWFEAGSFALQAARTEGVHIAAAELRTMSVPDICQLFKLSFTSIPTWRSFTEISLAIQPARLVDSRG